MAVWNAYVWKAERLEWTAKDIVADGKDQAARRSLHALTCRPGQKANRALLRLKSYVYGHGECPEGMAIELVQVANGPSDNVGVI
jgi:hypothetical protein